MHTLGNIETTRHAYECETDRGAVKVYANTRTQAARIARDAGYVVRSVNMIG